MRSMKVSIYWRPTDQRPTDDRPLISKISNGHISATGPPIHFMLGSRVGFSGTADVIALFPVWTNPRWRPPPSWKNFKWLYLRNWSSDHSMFGSRVGFFGDGGSSGAISAMYGQFTCFRRQNHITSLLMHKTLELDFVWEGSLRFVKAIQFRGRK